MAFELRFSQLADGGHAAREYSLISPPRTLRRRILGMRPGELRGLRWDHLDLDQGVVHVWRAARRSGDVKTPKSRRSLILPKRAIAALHDHRKAQAAERLIAGEARQDNGLVFCHPDGRQYTRDDLNWRFGK